MGVSAKAGGGSEGEEKERREEKEESFHCRSYSKQPERLKADVQKTPVCYICQIVLKLES